MYGTKTDLARLKDNALERRLQHSIDRILLDGIPFCEFLSWVGGTDPDWVGELEPIDCVSPDIPHQYVRIKGIPPRIVGESIWV